MTLATILNEFSCILLGEDILYSWGNRVVEILEIRTISDSESKFEAFRSRFFRVCNIIRVLYVLRGVDFAYMFDLDKEEKLFNAKAYQATSKSGQT